MAAGQVKREALLVVIKGLVKANEDIEKGEVVYNDGNGWLAAPNTVVNAKLGVALESHDYSEASEHYIRILIMGCVSVQKISGTAIKQGQKVMIGGTTGEVTLFTKGDAPAGGVSTYYTTTIESGMQTALDKNVGLIVGTAAEDAASAATEIDVWVGVR